MKTPTAQYEYLKIDAIANTLIGIYPESETSAEVLEARKAGKEHGLADALNKLGRYGYRLMEVTSPASRENGSYALFMER